MRNAAPAKLQCFLNNTILSQIKVPTATSHTEATVLMCNTSMLCNFLWGLQIDLASILNHNYSTKGIDDYPIAENWEHGLPACVAAVPYHVQPGAFLRLLKRVPPHWGMPYGLCNYDFTIAVAQDPTDVLTVVRTCGMDRSFIAQCQDKNTVHIFHPLGHLFINMIMFHANLVGGIPFSLTRIPQSGNMCPTAPAAVGAVPGYVALQRRVDSGRVLSFDWFQNEAVDVVIFKAACDVVLASLWPSLFIQPGPAFFERISYQAHFSQLELPKGTARRYVIDRLDEAEPASKRPKTNVDLNAEEAAAAGIEQVCLIAGASISDRVRFDLCHLGCATHCYKIFSKLILF